VSIAHFIYIHPAGVKLTRALCHNSFTVGVISHTWVALNFAQTKLGILKGLKFILSQRCKLWVVYPSCFYFK